MKKIVKNIMVLAVLALGFSACTEEVEYTPALPCDVDSTAYRFQVGQETNVVLPLDATKFTVTLERVNTEAEEEIVLTSVADKEYITIPESVVFAPGQATATIEILLADSMKPFEEYAFEITLPEELINPYKADNYSLFNAVVKKEDYLPYGKGLYIWGLLGLQYENEIHYSEYLDAYRIVTPWVTPASAYVSYGYGAESGQSVDFILDEEGEIVMLSEKFKSGMVYPGGGSVVATFVEAETIDADDTVVYAFTYQWTCDLGSFGELVDYLQITEVY